MPRLLEGAEMASDSRSMTFTALVVLGMVIALAGVVMLLLGLGGSSSFDLKLGDWSVSTTSTGLAIVAIGAALAAGVALNLPDGVQVYGPGTDSPVERWRRLALPAAALALVALVAFVVTLLV